MTSEPMIVDLSISTNESWENGSSFSVWGHSQTMFTAMGGGGVRQMSTLLNKYGKFY